MSEFKQAIVVRMDLKMGKGKLAVQVAHASVEGFIKVSQEKPEWANEWLNQGQKKVVLKVENLDELLNILEEANKLKIPTIIIRDAGRTQLEPGTITCLAIGPGPSNIIDKVTGHLKLL